MEITMITEKLDRALDNIDPNTDKMTWLRFCEWIKSFHDIDTSSLMGYNNFATFEKNELKPPLKYLESIKDLWLKWIKAVEADKLANI
jgi:hypothetical protein